MPMLIPCRNQFVDSQLKSTDWFKNEKNIDMRKANNNEISKPVCLNL